MPSSTCRLKVRAIITVRLEQGHPLAAPSRNAREPPPCARQQDCVIIEQLPAAQRPLSEPPVLRRESSMCPAVVTSTPQGAPSPIGPYNHVAKVGDWITIGGVAGVDPPRVNSPGPTWARRRGRSSVASAPAGIGWLRPWAHCARECLHERHGRFPSDECCIHCGDGESQAGPDRDRRRRPSQSGALLTMNLHRRRR